MKELEDLEAVNGIEELEDNHLRDTLNKQR
jgi:hypothetical protein